MKKKFKRLFAFAMSIILVCASFVFAASAEDRGKILDEELKEIMAAASDDDIINKVFIGLETGFDKSEFEAKYGTGDEYIAAISAFFRDHTDRFIEKLPEDLKADIDHTDPYAACIWFNTTAKNIYRLAEYEEVTGIGYGEYLLHAEGMQNNVTDETTEPPFGDVPLAPLGDVNLDMKVTAADAREILRYAAQLFNNVYNKENADLNSDGKINAADARLALRTAARLNANKEVPCEAAVDKSKLDIRELSGSNVYDLSDPRQLVASMSYVFAAKVLRAVDYQTEFNKAATPDDVRDIEDEAMTFLEIEVVENLKGNLKLHTRIPYFKAGGVTADKKYIELFEHDLIPEEGKYYVFVAYAREGGTLIGGCEYGCAALEDGITEKNLNESSILQTYRDACANLAPVINDRDYLHNLAKYDTDLVG
ncbi:MAG: dockerin type I repeat-containing protein [Clostridia bacterium]|nr:dockerin type I repeat-containing protein [Clostridia bacterium]